MIWHYSRAGVAFPPTNLGVLLYSCRKKLDPVFVLTRRPEEGDKSTIIIGADISVTVVEVKGEQVRIGVSALSDVTVHRQEVYQQIQEALLSRNQFTV